MGVDYKLKTMTINEEEVSVQVWDTAGQVRVVACDGGVCVSAALYDE